MMNTVVLLLALVGCYLVVNGKLQNGVVAPGITNSSLAKDNSSHVTQVLASNPQTASTSVSPATSAAETNCECGVFSSETPTDADKPIVTDAPRAVTCDKAGQIYCNKLCTGDSALPEAVKEFGPPLLCAALGHYDKLKASVHSRICGNNVWTYTGLNLPTEICCHNHQVIDCKEHIHSSPADLGSCCN